MTLPDIVSENLRLFRFRKKLSQAQLADKAGLSVAYISLLERGQRTPPLGTVEQLAKALMAAPLDLLTQGRNRRE